MYVCMYVCMCVCVCVCVCVYYTHTHIYLTHTPIVTMLTVFTYHIMGSSIYITILHMESVLLNLKNYYFLVTLILIYNDNSLLSITHSR